MNESLDTPPTLTPDDFRALRRAVRQLEYPGLAARLAELVGAPIELLLKRLPSSASRAVGAAGEAALRKALEAALATMRKGEFQASKRAHKLAAAASGAIGGATGLAGLAVELPITTSIIFRSIADIARAEGEDIQEPETCLACMQVFALGSPTARDDDAVESGYFATRFALANAVQQASRALARGVITRDAPWLARLLVKLSARFGVAVSWKAAAQLVPVVGAVGGATINTLFLDHFQNVAQGHFTVRRLERTYGVAAVRVAYLDVLQRFRALQLRPAAPAPPPVPPPDAIDVEHRAVAPGDRALEEGAGP